MLLKHIKTFVTVVDENSFTEAAEKLYISQSAVSQQITALERELGVQLLERENRRFHLTEAGEFFHKRAIKLLRDADRCITQTRELARRQNTLTVGYPNLYHGAELGEAAAAFSAKFPEARLHILSGTHEELYRGLREQTIDLAINDQRRTFSEEYYNDVICHAPCCAELSRHHPLAGSTVLDTHELEETPLIIIAPEAQRAHEAAFYRDFLGFESPVLFADTLDQARMLAAGGQGFLPMDEVGTPLPTCGTTLRIPLRHGGVPIVRRYCLFRRRDNTNLCRSLLCTDQGFDPALRGGSRHE